MTFLRPEILYALFLLAVPIIIHLFEFRIFKPTAFTNLLFLEDLKNEQHRYQKLKKWVILFLRLGYFSGLITTFALPTILANQAKEKNTPVSVIYIDNSFSSMAKSSTGTTLLTEAKEELYQWSKSLEGNEINWFTNDAEYPNQSLIGFQQSILSLEASPRQLSAAQVMLRARRIFERVGTNNPHLIWFTDYHNWQFPSDNQNMEIRLRPLMAANRDNISLEEASIDGSDPDNARLSILLRNSLSSEQISTIRVYTEGKLFAQTGANLSPRQDKIVDFDLGAVRNLKGMVVIEDRGLSYDDTLYFNIPEQPRVKILSIGAASTAVLQSIYDENDFSFVQKDLNNFDYALIPGQNFIILDQVTKVSNPLITALKEHLVNGGGLLIIPEVSAIEATQILLDEFNLGKIESFENQAKKVVEIDTNDPFYLGIFEQDVAVFQYPTIAQSLNVKTDAKSLLTFDQGRPYFLSKNNINVFTGPITGPGTNFDQSPLSVVTLIQLALQTRIFPKPYYSTFSSNDRSQSTDLTGARAAIAGSLVTDQVLVLERESEQLIPRQKQVLDLIEIDFSDIEFKPGHYRARLENDELGWFSFNHPRDESHGNFVIPVLDSTQIATSKNMNLAITAINQTYEGKQLWFWFAIFALICFLAEMFILKQTT